MPYRVSLLDFGRLRRSRPQVVDSKTGMNRARVVVGRNNRESVVEQSYALHVTLAEVATVDSEIVGSCWA